MGRSKTQAYQFTEGMAQGNPSVGIASTGAGQAGYTVGQIIRSWF